MTVSNDYNHEMGDPLCPLTPEDRRALGDAIRALNADPPRDLGRFNCAGKYVHPKVEVFVHGPDTSSVGIKGVVFDGRDKCEARYMIPQHFPKDGPNFEAAAATQWPVRRKLVWLVAVVVIVLLAVSAAFGGGGDPGVEPEQRTAQGLPPAIQSDAGTNWTSPGAFGLYAVVVTAIIGPLVVFWMKRRFDASDRLADNRARNRPLSKLMGRTLQDYPKDKPEQFGKSAYAKKESER